MYGNPTMIDINGNDIAVRSSKTLTTRSFDRIVINHILEVFELDTGMDGSMCLVDGVLMHDQDGRSRLRISVGSNSTNLDGT
jgi:hypothetical protein